SGAGRNVQLACDVWRQIAERETKTVVSPLLTAAFTSLLLEFERSNRHRVALLFSVAVIDDRDFRAGRGVDNHRRQMVGITHVLSVVADNDVAGMKSRTVGR